MHLFMSSPSTDSSLSTPSADFEFEEFSIVPPELQDFWPAHPLAMADQFYSDQYGRLSAPSQEWTPSSAVRDCIISEAHLHRGDASGTLYSQNHQVSSFNLPLIYDSTLTTPVSLHPESPNPNGKLLNDVQWSRNDYPSLQYPLRGNGSIYMTSNSTSMKSKNDSSALSSADPDNMLAVSPYIFDSPGTPCPPTPYFGSFCVSAPSTTIAAASATTPSTVATPTVTVNAPSGGSNQAPILIAPSPHRRSRQRLFNESHVQQESQHSQQLQMGPQAHSSDIQSPPMGIKRECPSPTSKTKRRRRSVQPTVEQPKPVTRDDLSEEDKILLHLRDVKEDEKWDWKELTERFNRETGGKHNLAALQMRHTRLIERMRVWTDIEIRALNRAKSQYDNRKWKVIAETMLEYGCGTKWSPHACQLKWQELHPDEGTSEEYSTESWIDNSLIVSSPQQQHSNFSFSLGELDGDARGGTSPIIIDQTNQVTMKQRTGRKGSSRGSRSAYEQRHSWTVRPQ